MSPTCRAYITAASKALSRILGSARRGPVLHDDAKTDHQLRLTTVAQQVSRFESTLKPESMFHCNPRPSTLDPRPSTLDPRPSALDPRPSTLDPRPSDPNPESLFNVSNPCRDKTKGVIHHFDDVSHPCRSTWITPSTVSTSASSQPCTT